MYWWTSLRCATATWSNNCLSAKLLWESCGKVHDLVQHSRRVHTQGISYLQGRGTPCRSQDDVGDGARGRKRCSSVQLEQAQVRRRQRRPAEEWQKWSNAKPSHLTVPRRTTGSSTVLAHLLVWIAGQSTLETATDSTPVQLLGHAGNPLAWTVELQ